jgi:acetyl-CoA carboxylase carboxyltransferase component
LAGYFTTRPDFSASGIPQISIVMGSCTTGGAYVPAMSDETIIVMDQGTIFLGGPPLVKAATGEDVTDEELGGAKVHTSISGVADHLAENDHDAIQICRDIFETIETPERQKLSRIPVKEPIHKISELNGIIPQSLKEPYDVREVISRIVDGSEFSEFKKKLWQHTSHRICTYHGIPGWHSCKYRCPLFRVSTERNTFYPTMRLQGNTSCLSAKHCRIYGWEGIRTSWYCKR